MRASDPDIAGLIDRIGPCTLARSSEGTHFEALCRAIVYQQLSGRAAETIYGRFAALFEGAGPEPSRLLTTDLESLRAAGLSKQKAAYLQDLAHRCHSGALEVEELHNLDDDTVMEQVTAVKGIGRWTAQMFLQFRLGRPDILSELDLGIRKAMQRLYAMETMPTFAQAQEIGIRWSPYRSVASWYLWRSLE